MGRLSPSSPVPCFLALGAQELTVTTNGRLQPDLTLRNSDLSAFPPSSPAPDGSHSQTEPCPKNITWQPHRKGLENQKNFCRDQLKCEATLRERPGPGVGGSVCEELRGGPVPNFRCLMSPSLTPQQHTICQPGPGLYPSYRNTTWGSLYYYPPTFPPCLPPLCVTRRSKAEVCVLFFGDWAERAFFSNLRESFLHLDELATGYKPYQECQAITRIPDPDSSPVQGKLHKRASKQNHLPPSQPSISPANSLAHSLQWGTVSSFQTLFWAQGRYPGWWFHTVDSGSIRARPGSPSWTPSTAWLPGTSQHGTMETPWTQPLFSTHAFSSPIYNSREKRTSREGNKTVNTEMTKWR